MTYEQVMSELKRLGTLKNVAIYKRRGAGGNLFGVSYSDIEALRKKIKVDHELALKLWSSGNTDAQALATMIADPERMSMNEVESWVSCTTYYELIDLIVRYIGARSRYARKLMERWTRSKEEFVGQAGWDLLGTIAMQENEIDDACFEKYLEIIEKEIHSRKNRTRHAMNNALICIGIRNPRLRQQAIAAAKRIGNVEVDHGDTGCKTPDAVQYIMKAATRRKEKK
jgi:3-methyladenine DNA glycosylase AlkD